MKARRRRGAENQNLDSLLDTMANVTGILVVLLAVTQISVRDAVARLQDELVSRPELSREAFLAAEQEAAMLQQELAPLLPSAERQEELRRERRSELSGLRARISLLEKDLAQIGGEPRDEAALRRALDASRQQATRLEQEIADHQHATAAAARELESLPARAGSRELRLPDPRPPPSGAQQAVYFCRHGRIFRVDGRDMLEKLWDGVHRATGGTTRERLRRSTLDRTRVVEYFQNNVVGTRELRWHVLESGGELVGQLEWRRQDLGETLGQIQSALSSYRGDLLRFSPGNLYFHYFVWDDSFEVYASAREMADRAGFAAGWTPYDAPRPFRQPLTQLAQNTLID